MRRIIYSNYTKVLAVLLFIASIIFGTLTVTNGVAQYYAEKEEIYLFESDFSQSRAFGHLLEAPELAVFNAYYDLYSGHDETEKIRIKNDNAIVEEDRAIDKYIQQRLDDLYCLDKINYYVEWNGQVYTNCEATTAKDLIQAQIYRYFSRDENGNIEWESSQTYRSYPKLEEVLQYDRTSTITVCTSIKDSYAKECENIWLRQAGIVNNTFRSALACVVLVIIVVIYLICVCGKNKDGEHNYVWVDNIWLEVHLAAVGVLGFGAVAGCMVLLDEHFSGRFPLDFLKILLPLIFALTSTVILTSILSVIRNIKCKKIIESSVVIRILKWMWRTFAKVVKWFLKKVKSLKNILIGALSKKTNVILISMLFVYTAIIGICGIFTLETPLSLMVGIFLFAFATFVVAYRTKDLDEVKKGAKEIKNGNLAYKIPEPKSEDMKLLASDINDIARGLEKSVSEKLKAEQLKTQLITNVSHDLKTPLTSIISYTELLSNVENLPQEAKDYIQVIVKKSDRLKTLTQDLFDISKVQSGNEDTVFKKIDVSLLINQALGEYDGEIKESELPFCVDVSKELYILADGRKLSRVIGNLINNILKYTLKNTRVFVSALERNNEVIIEFKNISSYPMDFNADEIVGRFVRADKSRTTEGSGLGLAIAKSYVEVCNGNFDVVIDGDMFKAIIKFDKYN